MRIIRYGLKIVTQQREKKRERESERKGGEREEGKRFLHLYYTSKNTEKRIEKN